MPDAVCSSCGIWPTAPDDAFCSWCGSPCADIRLELNSHVVQAGEFAPKLQLQLTNSSCAKLRINRVTIPQWIVIPGLRAGLEFPPGPSGKITVTVNSFDLAQSSLGEISIETNLGRRATTVIATQGMPAPTIEPARIEVWSRAGSRPWKTSVKIHCQSGYMKLLDVLPPGENWLRASYTGGAAILSPNQGALIETEIDVPALAASLGRDTSRGVILTLIHDGPHGPRTMPAELMLELRRPPELNWLGKNERPAQILQSGRQRLKFRFANRADNDQIGGRGNASLHIADARLETTEGERLPTIARNPYPADIPGGEHAMLEFELDAESLPLGLRNAVLVIDSNLPEARFAIPLEIREMRTFEGLLAIDFGTSNTCCAVLDDGTGETEAVSLDDHETTSPTVLRYLDISGPQPEIETGIRVKNLAAADEGVAASTLSRLKQQLGEATHPLAVRPMRSGEWVHREAADAVADYLRHIRRIAEDAKGARFRRFLLTHPAVCSVRQYRNLHRALRDAFGQETRAGFLQEPIAALIPLFAAKADDRTLNSYTVAAFDIGGGTTDVTIVHVRHERIGESVEIRPEIRSSWGERFGGEDLTDFLVAELSSRCLALLKRRGKGQRLVDRDTPGAATAQVLRNENELRGWAEKLKASMSEERQAYLPTTLSLSTVAADPRQPPEEVMLATDELLREGSDPRGVFLEHLRRQIVRLADRLAMSCEGLPPLDFVQLSGKTAFLPVVREVLSSRFTARIERAAEPKECVVRGACLAQTLARGRLKRLVLPAVVRTTSSIGLMDPETQRFVKIVPRDAPIPEAGLVCESRVWLGAGLLVLWENLGVDDRRRHDDGSENTKITRLGSWQLAVGQDPEKPVVVRVKMLPDFSIEVSAAADGPFAAAAAAGESYA